MSCLRQAWRLVLLLTLAVCCGEARAADWPMWRGDAGRTAEWSGELADELHLQWVRRYPPLEPAFRNPRLQFDQGYEPVVAGKTLLVGSSRNDRVTALDTETGAERWRFYAEGPVRFAPVAWNDRVYFGSDDGYLYCLAAADGRLLWKFHAVPSDRKLLGNGRLISVWPVRGGPVISDGRLYFAAGVWSFEGVFVYALDAETGDVVWVNDRAGFIYGQHPHDAQAFGGLTPQGYLVVHNNELIVPCGTALPARFDLASGELKYFALPRQGRFPGGWFTSAAAKALRRGEEVEDKLLFDQGINRDRHEGGWYDGPGTADVRSRIFLNGKAFSLEDEYEGVTGTVHSILAADAKLFVVTREGDIHCFGPNQIAEPKRYEVEQQSLDRPDDGWRAKVEKLVAATGIEHGFALCWGVGSGRLVEELAAQSQLQTIVVDPDLKKCSALRRRLDDAGLLGTRVAIHHGNPLEFRFPPYVASLIVSEDLTAAGFERGDDFAEQLFQALRPFGGTACLAIPESKRPDFEAMVRRADLAGAPSRQVGDLTLLTRAGALPGSANYTGGWTSVDDRVRAPLGVLWFDDAVAHFKRAPQPMFVDGVMISYDKDWKGWVDGDRPPYSLTPPTYSDVYTGRVLAQQELARLAPTLPTRDLQEKQAEQYRPPTQGNPWKPQPPVIGERVNPLTGKSEPRAIPKSYGCDGGIDYGYLFTLRSGTAAFYDKRLDSGTIHISGPRSGCTNSVIPANGLLNVPYFYQGCTCSYPLPVGLALVSLPAEHEQWSVWGPGQPESIQRIGINFGAPGNRMTPAGTLWLEHPRVGGPAPDVRLTTEPASPDTYYQHSIWMQGGTGWPWVAASGMRDVQTISLEGLKETTFTVRLYFAEPDVKQPGQRVFDVSLQGQRVLQDFDIVEQAGGRMRAIVQQFRGIRASGQLDVTFVAKSGVALICGIELIAEGLDLDPLAELKPPSTQPQLIVAD